MRSNHNPTLTASKISLIYALISVVWILFSDQLLAATVTTVETITRMQMVKGWAFVLTTSVLIFFLLRQEMNRFFKADEAQRESESNFRLLVENAPDAIFVQSRGRFAYLNAAAVALFGATDTAQLIGKSVMDRYHPDFHEIVRERIHQVNEERKPAPPIEQIYVRMDGSHLNVEVNSIPFIFDGENGALVFVRDITERKMAEEALRRFELLVENSRDIILFINREDGRILEANTAASGAYSYSRDELLKLTVQDLREPNTLGHVSDQMAKADAEGILFETIHRRKDGTSFPVEISSKGATINGMRALISVGRDITKRKRSEEALRNSELQFRNLANSMPQLVWTATPDGKMDYFNRRIEEFHGFVKQPSGGWEWSVVVHPEDLKRTIDTWQHAMDSGLTHEMEHRLLQRDGSYKWYLSRTTPVRDQEGRVAKWYGTSTEINNIKHAEQKLLEATTRLDYLVTESPAVVFTYELQPQPRLNYVSRNVETILGWKPEQFTENFECWKEHLHPADLPVVFDGLMQLKKAGKQVFEYRFKDTKGKYHWIHDEQRLIIRDDGCEEVIGAWWDVTDTKAAQEELRRLATAIDQAAEIVLITDEKADIVYANPAFEKITGYSRMEVLGKNPRILKSGEQDHAFYQQMWASLSAGRTWHGRFVNKKKNGSLYTEEATISPVLDTSGNVINYVAVKRDITKEQELEQQYLEAQKMEAIGTLAGGIAHDFNNILAIILANAQILEFSEAISTESKETLNQIIIASKRARELVRQILAISRRGKQEKIIMNLKPIVKETIGLLRASLPATIRLEPHITANTGMLFADPTQMQQVLMNLCTNAAHAMEKEGGTLKITLSNTSVGENDPPLEPGFAPGEYVKLSVSDTGHGMQPWILKRIFEPYFTTKETGKGTGLGLSVAHGIVKSHGGAVKVSSVVRKGSIFEIYLPRVKGEASETDKVDMPLLTGTGRILFVDDEPALTMMGQRILGQLGYQVKTTNSSPEALAIFRSKPHEFDLVITDLTMPELTGINLAKALLEIRPDLPIVLCTGFSDQVNEEMLQSIGIHGLLLKPITIHELAHSVRMAIEVKR